MLYELKNVTKTYKVNDSINHAIDNISLDIEKGEVIVILGPSGSGKSTMLNLLSGIDTPTKGKIYFESDRIDNKKLEELSLYRRNNLGFIF